MRQRKPEPSEDPASFRIKVAILARILDPYKTPIYRYISGSSETTVVLSAKEDNRRWNEEILGQGLNLSRVFGLTFKWHSRDRAGRVFNTRYLHLDPGFVWELCRLRPDAVITTELGFRSIAGVVYGLLTRKPVWVWLELTKHSELRTSRIRRWVRRQFFVRAVQHWISCGEACSEYLKSIGVHNSRILQVQLTTDETPYTQEVEPLPLDLRYPRVLVVGQLVTLKGVDQLLDALGTLKENGQDFSLIMVGDGPERERLLEKADRLLGADFFHVPYLPPEDMPKVYKASSFLAFPTLQDVWGLVVNEAILSGIPVVSSIYAGCTRELVPVGNQFDPLNPRQFEDVLLRAVQGAIDLTNPDKLRSSEWVANAILQDLRKNLKDI